MAAKRLGSWVAIICVGIIMFKESGIVSFNIRLRELRKIEGHENAVGDRGTVPCHLAQYRLNMNSYRF